MGVERNKPVCSHVIAYPDAADRKVRQREVIEDVRKKGDNMDELLQKYIDKVDRDQSDLRQDIRESENRVMRNMDRIETLIKEQKNDMHTEFTEMKESIKDNKKDIQDNKKFMWGIAISIMASVITSIGIIYSTYYSTISLIQNMINK